jgi:proteasome lid subunit RPN8/RPN11
MTDFIFPVYIIENILKEIQDLSKKYNLEVFGYLVGEIFKWENKKYILIEDQIFIESGTNSTPYTVSQIEGTAGLYEESFQKLKQEKNNPNLRIVGWWHSHPGFGCFLSKTDVQTQNYFFPEPFQVALVIDPLKNEFNFFNQDDNSKHGYKPISYAVVSSK